MHSYWKSHCTRTGIIAHLFSCTSCPEEKKKKKGLKNMGIQIFPMRTFALMKLWVPEALCKAFRWSNFPVACIWILSLARQCRPHAHAYSLSLLSMPTPPYFIITIDWLQIYYRANCSSMAQSAVHNRDRYNCALNMAGMSGQIRTNGTIVFLFFFFSTFVEES